MKNLALIIFSFLSVQFSMAQKPIKLFNGKNLKNWTVKIYHHEVGDNYAGTFRVEDGIIKVRYDKYKEFNDRFGHLYYKTPYSNFRLNLEYRFTGNWQADAPSYTLLNSGVMFHAQDPKTILKEQDWPISVEMQFLAETKEGVKRPTGNMCSPGTDVFFEGKKDPRHCIESSSNTYKKEEWVKAELEVYGDSLVIHKINGAEVLRYTKPSVGGGVATGFDPRFKIDGTALKRGYIALQSEGQEIDFRNIYLVDLRRRK